MQRGGGAGGGARGRASSASERDERLASTETGQGVDRRLGAGGAQTDAGLGSGRSRAQHDWPTSRGVAAGEPVTSRAERIAAHRD